MNTESTDTDDEPFDSFDWGRFCERHGLEPGQSVDMMALMDMLRQSTQVEASSLTGLALLDTGVEAGVFETGGTLYEYRICDGDHFSEGPCQE